MAKSLSQITFEFGFDAQAEQVPAESPVQPVSQDQAGPAISFIEEEPVSEAPPEPEKKPVSGRGRRSLKDIAASADLLQVPPDEELFSKSYYSMGEVATMFRENQSLIRYWETEFDILQPKKNGKGDRFFRPVDVKNLALIYDLLRRRKFTIEGAKDFLKTNKNAEERFVMIQSLEKIRGFLLELKASLQF